MSENTVPALHVHFIDSLRVGGAQTQLATMLAHSVKHFPYRHRVVCLFGPGPMTAEFAHLGIEVEIVDLGPLIRRRSYSQVIAMLRAMLEHWKPTVVEAHLSYSRFFALPAAWLANVPIRIGFEQGDLYLNAVKYRVAHYAAQYACQKVVVCSDALAGWAQANQGLRKQKVAVINNCIDPDQFDPDSRRSTERFGFGPDTTVLCAIGTLGYGVNKRVDVTIRAVEKLCREGLDVGLVVCGDGEQRPALQKLIDDLKIPHRVRMLGLQRDVVQVLANSDVFCHAAPFEPFGIVCIEAMAMNLPAIVPRSGGIAGIVEHGVTGLIYDPLDVSGLAGAIAQLHNDPSLRKLMGARARRRVLERYTVAGYLDALYSLYGTLGDPAHCR